jgi:hypothetical protein
VANADIKNMYESGIEIYSDGRRKQRKYFCRVCGMKLGDSAHPVDNIGTREEISNLLCADCQKKIDAGIIQAPDAEKNTE